MIRYNYINLIIVAMKIILIAISGILFSTYSIYRIIGLTPASKKDTVEVGIDISHWNTVYDWKKVNRKVDFCIIKATEGSNYRDPKFRPYWNSCKNLKITKGAYHFFKPGTSAEAQFNNFKRNVKLSTGDFPPILDVEVWNGTDMKEVNAWLKLAEEHYGVKPIVYTTYFFYKANIEGRLDSKYPLWIYFNQKTGFRPSPINEECVLWQYDQAGKVDGIFGKVDLDAVCREKGSLTNILIK
jgi:lysozyme